ncbi:hypothetical protein GIB67_026593 [Kingdonia uniflora]|uniref:Uncharacterized protein n=1 Tax=Kingdonia uniflora TaxID=39325 RepID=A0A7J7NNA4_9MAGN|nr:hypothetical protein GIB67_026593 [Kingdonia uniflora]
MEEEKKRKKNKKKKNKQSKTTSEIAVVADNGETTTSIEKTQFNALLQKYNELMISSDGPASEMEMVESGSFHKADYIAIEKEFMFLQREKDAWLQKETSLVDKVRQLENDKKAVTLMENSAKDVVNRLNEDKMGLLTQVKELEGSRNFLLQKNQELVETIYDLKKQIQHLEKNSSFAFSKAEMERMQHASRDDDLMAQIQAERSQVEKLDKQNVELIEKVNELSSKLDQRSLILGYSSPTSLDQMVTVSEPATMADHMSDISEKILVLDDRTDSPLNIQSTADDDKDMSITVSRIQIEELPLRSFETGETEEEIVQVSLDDNELQDVAVSEPTAETGDESGVPLTDAPLIGAPFRLISFFAKYVSGADLVKKNTSSSGN